MTNQHPTYYKNWSLCIFLGIFLQGSVLGQCPDKLFIASSEQLLMFATDYPNCTTIAGNVFIEGFDTERIQNLDGLNQLKSIDGSLFIGNHLSLHDLSSLSQLENIEGDLTISNNPTLEVLTSFTSLSRVGGTLKIVNCQQLQSAQFPVLETIGNNLTVFYNRRLESVSGFSQVKEVGGDLRVIKNDVLKDLRGFEQVITIGGGLVLYSNSSLKNLWGLKNLQRIQDRILLVDNDSLSDCLSGFCYRFLPSQRLTNGYIRDNACGCNSALEIRATCLGDTVNCNPTYTIAGSIQTPVNLPIREVTIRLSGVIEDSIQTDEWGVYRFEDLPIGEYYLHPSKVGDYVNGVTLVDATLIASHANGTPPFLDDPYKVLAADINQSQSITIEDSNLVKRLAQGAISTWEMVNAWGFIRADIDLKDLPNDPWTSLESFNNEQAIIHIPILGKDHLSANFIGYKHGDANNSVSP